MALMGDWAKSHPVGQSSTQAGRIENIPGASAGRFPLPWTATEIRASALSGTSRKGGASIRSLRSGGSTPEGQEYIVRPLGGDSATAMGLRERS